MSQQLTLVANEMPLRWGEVQNDQTDNLIDLFSINDIDELKNRTSHFPESVQNYFRRRWFLWRCSQCDEWIFYAQPGVVKNPNTKDQDWDVEFHNNKTWRFDIKGTTVPRSLRTHIDQPKILTPKLVDFYYQNQSTGIRNQSQNRLFLVHYSEDLRKLNHLRTRFIEKAHVAKSFVDLISSRPNHQFLKHSDNIAEIIYIRDVKGKVYYTIGSTLFS